MSEWISVKDRMPETYGRYLVHVEDIAGHEPQESCEYIEYYWGNGRFTGWEIFRVTHWMPLPEPPESEEDVDV